MAQRGHKEILKEIVVGWFEQERQFQRVQAYPGGSTWVTGWRRGPCSGMQGVSHGGAGESGLT